MRITFLFFLIIPLFFGTKQGTFIQHCHIAWLCSVWQTALSSGLVALVIIAVCVGAIAVALLLTPVVSTSLVEKKIDIWFTEGLTGDRRCRGLSTFVRPYVGEDAKPMKRYVTISPPGRLAHEKHVIFYCIDTIHPMGFREGMVNSPNTYPHKIDCVNKRYGPLMGKSCLSIVRYTSAIVRLAAPANTSLARAAVMPRGRHIITQLHRRWRLPSSTLMAPAMLCDSPKENPASRHFAYPQSTKTNLGEWRR